MGHSYQAVGWNRQKKVYDRTLLLAVVAYLAVFIGVGAVLFPQATVETLVLRALGTGAFALLHVVLAIGPLCRLSPRFLPLLYNRRHMGVTMFVLAFVHGAFALVQFHGFGDVSPLVSLFASNTRFDSLAQFPFQPLGFLALLILFLMAATSHDFWLTNLTAPVWKGLHLLVHVAYALIVMHVALGVLQAETSPVWAGALGAGLLLLLGLQFAAALAGKAGDEPWRGSAAPDGFVDVGPVDGLPDGRAKIVALSGERVAVFREGNRVSALSNVCQHQNGPLGEGRIIDGFVTCPWHGYQYAPDCGRSPAPFTERVPTFRTRVEGGRVWVDPRPLPAGTRVEPARVSAAAPSGTQAAPDGSQGVST